MREILEQVNSHAWVILHHRWIALVSGFIICIAGWFVADKLPDKYEVEAKFFFDTKTVLKPLLKGLAVDSDVKQESISLIKRTLTSRPNLIKVSQETEMDLGATDPIETEYMLEKLRDDIVISAVSISRQRTSDNIYSISYQNNNPELAKKVVDALLNLFVESLLGITRKDSDKAEEFLDEKIEEYRLKLESAEENLKQFKQKNAGLIPGEGVNYFSKLSTLESNLDEAMLNLREEHNKNESIKQQINDLLSKSREEVEEILVPLQEEKSPLELRIENLELRLSELTLQYTERHPDVISTRSALEELKAQRKTQESETPQVGETVKKEKKSIESSPLFQEMKLMLSASNSETAAIQARIDEYRNKIAEMKALVNIMPEIEARMTSLARNYEIQKETYDNLVQRRASARISREAEQTGSEFQFNII
ncbi:MAG: hypothetical protein MI673_01735, partial [Thiotrichales bacterium]|nr:hypothetical protein [Thiotrichales bacterium]